MEQKHTPGPYQFHAQDTETMIITGKTTGWGHDHIAMIVTPTDSPEHSANLHLFLAAPEMLEALLVARQTIMDLPVNRAEALLEAQYIIGQAIAKATGN